MPPSLKGLAHPVSGLPDPLRRVSANFEFALDSVPNFQAALQSVFN